jgi:two-component system KDP operon response regulator KdpE
MNRVLVVDDEVSIRRALGKALAANGYTVRLAESGDAASVDLATWAPDVVVLDLVMPGRDGFDVLRELRTWSDMPVIVLSARGQERDKVLALDAGADDYLTKPFGIEELLARMRAVARRLGASDGQHLAIGDIVIDHAAHSVTVRGDAVHLTPTEYQLLSVLAANVGRVMTHRQLLERVWGAHAADNGPQLRVYINYLRGKLERDPAHPEIIVTEPGVGYRLHP